MCYLTVCISFKTGTKFFIPPLHCLTPCLFVMDSLLGSIGGGGVPACTDGGCESESLLVTQRSGHAKALTQVLRMITTDINEHSTTCEARSIPIYAASLRSKEFLCVRARRMRRGQGQVPPGDGGCAQAQPEREPLLPALLPFPTGCIHCAQIVISGKLVLALWGSTWIRLGELLSR